MKNLVHSPARITALGKYLTALANFYSLDVAATRQARETSTKRKRLHILYILSDVIHHTYVRDRNPGFAEKIELALPALIQAAAAFSNAPKHSKKVLNLVDIWDEKGYFPPAFIQKLRTTIREAPDIASKAHAPADGTLASSAKSSKDAPFIMPAMHGDATVLWYDLPAANWLPVIEPNSIRPMNPDMIKPLKFAAGPADKSLVKAVQDLLADVDRIYRKDQYEAGRPTTDIDQLGQRVVLDEVTREVLDGETYYGWSRAFCEKMKQRRKKASGSGDDDRGRSRSVSHSRSSSRSSSRPAYKRRRVSSSRSLSRSRSRSRSRSDRRSYSRERRRRSYSSSRSPSRDRQYRRDASRSPRRSPSAPSYDPPRYGTSNGKQPSFPDQPLSHNPQYPQSNPAPPFPPSFPPIPPDLSQFMVPPPPPPNYQGQWPPPPPPPPVGGVPPGMPPNWLQDMVQMGGWPANSPPPPPQQPPSQYGGSFQQQGRGGRGRGDYRGYGNRGGWDHRGRGW